MSAEHHTESFWTKYIFSQDHKVIGIQYGITSLLFLLFGFSLMIIMRWQLAYPDTPIPIIGWMFENRMLSPDMYNSFGCFFMAAVNSLIGMSKYGEGSCLKSKHNGH